MSWFASFLVALLTGVLALFVGGFIASLAVSWYRISSFEGGAGYFVVGIALVSLVAGIGIGLIVTRVSAAAPNPATLKALGVSVGIVLTLGAVIAGAARLVADVPPEIDGETLLLAVELRWPATEPTDPRTLPGTGFTRLSAGASHVIRKSEDGPLLVDDARREDGRWIVPGAVGIFTERGDRILSFRIGERDLGGFLIPLPGHPTARHQAWSEWMPRSRPGGPPVPDSAFTVRFRVQRRSEPIRTERIGPFEVATIASYFYGVSGTDRLAAAARFRISRDGQVVPGLESVGAVSSLPAPSPALLVQTTDASANDQCQLVADDGGQTRVTPIGSCPAPIPGALLTSDPTEYQRANALITVPGWVDRERFAIPGLYLITNTVFDTRTLTARETTYPSDPPPINGLPPIGLSPDRRSFVWFTHDGSDDHPVLGVTDWQADRHYTVPIDRDRMRFGDYRLIDPAWVDHHFTWVRGADGIDSLVARPHFVPLPHKGELTVNKPGEYQSYTIQPAGDALRQALIAVLVEEIGAVRLPLQDGYRTAVRVDGEELDVQVVDNPGYVSFHSFKGNPAIIRKVAATLDRALATGRYDALVRKDAP